MSIEWTLADHLYIQEGTTEKLPVDLASSEAALCEKLREIGMKDATLVLWQVQGVAWGRWQGGGLRLAGDEEKRCALWRELRIFNDEEELHLKKIGARWRGRLRRDGTGKATEYVDSIARFWGERGEAAKESENVPDGYMKLVDTARKLTLLLPQVEPQAKYYGLVTRSYIGYEATGQAGYTDCRYVRIASADVKGGTGNGTA